MNELLFGNINEKEALENILALNQIKKCDEEIEKYTNEINEQKDEMINILKDQDIDETYVEKIHKYKNLITNMDGDNNRVDELNDKIAKNEERIVEFQKKINEIEKELEVLKKEIFETNDPSRVIDCQNEIENNNARLNDLNDILNGLISDNTPLLIEKEYLIAKNNDYDFNIPNYNRNEINEDLDKISKEFEEAISNLDLPVRENIEFCQKKISNRELEIEKYNNRKKQVIEAFPNALSLNVEKAFEDIKELLSELGIGNKCEMIDEDNIFDKDEETFIDNDIEKEDSVKVFEDEPREIKEEMNFFSDEEDDEEPLSVDIEEPIFEDNNNETEEVISEENNNEPETIISEEQSEEGNDEIESVSYVLSDGESLANIAEKVYPSKDNWEAIYYFNKDVIDKFLVSNGISDDFETIKELAEDTSLFAGIKLEIPTDYNYKK